MGLFVEILNRRRARFGLGHSRCRWDCQIWFERVRAFHHDLRCCSQLLIRAEIIILQCRDPSYKGQPLSHASLAIMSSPLCVPVFDVHSNRQDGLLGFQAFYGDKANAYTTTYHAAGSVCSPPFPSSSPHPVAIYAFDQWTALLNTDGSSNLYAACPLGIPVSDPSFTCGFRESELSSCDSSYVILASLLTSRSVLPRTLVHLHRQWHHLWVVTVHCITPPRTCFYMFCRTH